MLATGSNWNALCELGMVVWAYNPSVLEAEAELPWVWGQPGLWRDLISKNKKTHNKKRKFALTLLQLFARQFIIYTVGRKATRCAGICRHKSCFSNYARYLSITLSMIAYIFIYRHELKSWNKFLWLSLEIESCREGRTGRSYRSWL